MNPKFDAFLKDNKEMTLIGLAWALFWRLYVVILGIAFALAFFSALLGA